MTIVFTRGRRIVAATLVAAAALGAVAAPSTAEARGWRHGHGGHYGYGAAAIGGGLLLGPIIASNSRAYAQDCWVEKRRGYDAYGYPVVRRVRVCD